MHHKVKYGVLEKADLGRCPSCNMTMALPALTLLDKLYSCPICRASSYAYKWLADKGASHKARQEQFIRKMQEFPVDKEYKDD